MMAPTTWTANRLEHEWIGGPLADLGVRAQIAISAFNCIEQHLGPTWLLKQRQSGFGPVPTLGIILLGECISAIQPLQNSDELVQKIRVGDVSAIAEAEAVRFFSLLGDVEIELTPNLNVENLTGSGPYCCTGTYLRLGVTLNLNPL